MLYFRTNCPPSLSPLLILAGLSSAVHAAEPIHPRLQHIVPHRPSDLQFPERTPDGRVVISAQLGIDPVTGSQEAISAEQDAFLRRCQSMPGAIVIGRATHVLNAVFLAVHPEDYSAVAKDPAVTRLSPVANYRLEVQETVPYIGATTLQTLGVDGSGVRIAVLDSGVDYHHAALGGSGLVEDYTNNDPNVVEPGTFPTAKVVGGFDFVGPVWPFGPLLPDPDPLDLEGHGTHVADIIAGAQGVAPGASLYAYQVCSSVDFTCAGVSLILGMDFSADPNRDGSTEDHVHIINLSLGSDYGQPFDDDLSTAVENASRIGILTVSAAGNGGNRPYVLSAPAASTSALAVAETQVPSAVQDFMRINAPTAFEGLYPVVRQSWSSDLRAKIDGPVIYGDGFGGNLEGCAPFLPNSVDGWIVLVDRGTCPFSDKIRHIEQGGGRVGIIGLVTQDAPFDGAFGGGDPVGIPGFMLDQSTANVLRFVSSEVQFSPEDQRSLAGSVVASSARGPRVDNRLKPDIGAPGASRSAEAGTGTETGTFGGTSGAAPMVSGAAALLLSQEPSLLPWQLRTKLMNYARPLIPNEPFGSQGGISRIGAGELDVREAFQGRTLAYEPKTRQATLNFGFVAVARKRLKRRQLRIHNRAAHGQHYTLTNAFSHPEQAESGALKFSYPSRIYVPANSARTITIKAHVRADRLVPNLMNSGSDGNRPDGLSTNEFGGYFVLESDYEVLTVPWYMLPRKSSRVVRYHRQLQWNSAGEAKVPLFNSGMGSANNQAYTLMALSDRQPAPIPGSENPRIDLRSAGVRTQWVPAGFCGPEASFIIEIAFQLWQPLALALPVTHIAYVDTTGDGVFDFLFINGDFSLLTGEPAYDGRNLSVVVDNSGFGSAAFFTEHATNSRNTVITACADQLGLTLSDFGQTPVTVAFATQSAYFNAPLADVTEPVSFVLGAERYTAEVEDIPAFGFAEMLVTDHRTPGPNLGILLMTNGDRGPTNRGGATPFSEGLLFTP